VRTLLAIVGAALVGTGVVWILQGADVLKGSSMTGQSFWGWMGAIAVVVGTPMLVLGLRRRRS